MTSLVKDVVGERRTAGWDAAVAVLLGLALLGAGWLDVRAFLAHGSRPQVPFAFLDPAGGEYVGDAELFRWNDDFVMLDNFGGPESGPLIGRYRQALGPTETILISARETHARLEFKFYNPTVGQDITVRFNDQPLEQFSAQPEGAITRQYPLTLRPGINSVTFVFSRYNHAGAVINATDGRPLAGTFLKLGLTLN